MMAAIAILLSLGIDTLAVAVGLGLAGLPRSRWLGVGAVFACFEGAMPIAGLLLGRGASKWVGAAAPYLAGGVLLVLGILALREAVAEARERRSENPLDGEPSREDAPDGNDAGGEDESLLRRLHGKALLLTGLSVSVDELAAGFSLGVFHLSIAMTAGYLAAQAFALTLVGLFAGQRLGGRFQERAELIAGLLLTLIGALVLLEAAAGRAMP